MSIDDQPFAWRSIIVPVFLPTLLFGLGEGAILPIIPLVAENLGGSIAIAGAVAGVLTIGELFGNIPSGWIVSRVGERPAMIGASVIALVGLVICVIAPNPVALGFGVLLVGLATAMFSLAETGLPRELRSPCRTAPGRFRRSAVPCASGCSSVRSSALRSSR